MDARRKGPPSQRCFFNFARKGVTSKLQPPLVCRHESAPRVPHVKAVNAERESRVRSWGGASSLRTASVCMGCLWCPTRPVAAGATTVAVVPQASSGLPRSTGAPAEVPTTTRAAAGEMHLAATSAPRAAGTPWGSLSPVGETASRLLGNHAFPLGPRTCTVTLGRTVATPRSLRLDLQSGAAWLWTHGWQYER